jgi:hypothetical protein
MFATTLDSFRVFISLDRHSPWKEFNLNLATHVLSRTCEYSLMYTYLKGPTSFWSLFSYRGPVFGVQIIRVETLLRKRSSSRNTRPTRLRPTNVQLLDQGV